MIVNGVELEDIDILDYEVAEKYEKALDSVKGIGDNVKGLKTSESIKLQCETIFDVFNTLWGEGTDRKVFGTKVNLLICFKAFEELVAQTESNSKEQYNEMNKIVSKYSPNRATRRSKK